ncbi:uncharacterized protein TrAtP1_001587 [Trichoderma atroviride]|uniref:uncharacterized protein n=1 Tax=Hypocrea atroviridis TaxID=63577 RepID=UPI0033166D7A|nr:hypothetical protein TrAtP1_001587 [Trichoderma atroviride]
MCHSHSPPSNSHVEDMSEIESTVATASVLPVPCRCPMDERHHTIRKGQHSLTDQVSKQQQQQQ